MTDLFKVGKRIGLGTAAMLLRQRLSEATYKFQQSDAKEVLEHIQKIMEEMDAQETTEVTGVNPTRGYSQ